MCSDAILVSYFSKLSVKVMFCKDIVSSFKARFFYDNFVNKLPATKSSSSISAVFFKATKQVLLRRVEKEL